MAQSFQISGVGPDGLPRTVWVYAKTRSAARTVGESVGLSDIQVGRPRDLSRTQFAKLVAKGEAVPTPVSVPPSKAIVRAGQAVSEAPQPQAIVPSSERGLDRQTGLARRTGLTRFGALDQIYSDAEPSVTIEHVQKSQLPPGRRPIPAGPVPPRGLLGAGGGQVPPGAGGVIAGGADDAASAVAGVAGKTPFKLSKFLLKGGLLGSAIAAAPAVAEFGQDTAARVSRAKSGVDAEAARADARERSLVTAQALRHQNVRRAMAENEARLAATKPHLYAELMAGQTLARGDVVFGGKQDRSLLESFLQRITEDAGTSPAAQHPTGLTLSDQ